MPSSANRLISSTSSTTPSPYGPAIIPIKEDLLDENAKILSESDKKHMDSIQHTIDRINNNEDVSLFIKAIWNSETHSIELVRK